MTERKKLAEIQSGAKIKAKKQKYFSIFLVAVIILAFLIIAFLNLFNIKTVTVEGISPSLPYTAEKVKEFLAIEEGTNLLTYDSRGATESLLYEFPYIKSVKVRKRLPSTLLFEVTENKGTLYLQLGDDIFILASDGAVLEITGNPFADGRNKTELVTNGVSRCVCGENVEFTNEDTEKIMLSVMGELDKYSLGERITRLDIRDKFDIRMMYDNRFEIKVGNMTDMENKIKLFAGMMNNKIWDDSTGSIDISNGVEAYVKFGENVAN